MDEQSGVIRGWGPIVSLGLMTCTCYGAAFYAYGILIGPIHGDAGWSLTFLGSIFAVSQLIGGFGASLAGRLLDRWGGQLIFQFQALASIGLLVASWMENAFAFAVLTSTSLGVMGACGFYHISTAIAGRVGPSSPGKSITVLTAIGAFCSPVYLPVGALLIEAHGWRPTIRIFALVAFAGALQASHFAAGGKSESCNGPSNQALRALRSALANAPIRRMLTAYAFAGFSYSTLLVYQVPIMMDKGLAVGTAASIAGLRGFCQLFGRVGVIAAIARSEAAYALRVSYLAAAVASLSLLSGNLWLALIYALLAGASLGASTPLQAINAQQNFNAQDLGLLMGLQQTILAVAGAVGPITAGLTADLTGSQTPTVWLATCSLIAAVFLLSKASDATRK